MPGRDEQEQPARPHLVERGGKEIIVDGKLELIPVRIMHGVITERHIGDGEIESIVHQLRFFKRLLADVRIGIQRRGDARGQRINFNAGDG